MTSANSKQVGGAHYKKLGMYQPWEVLRYWLTPEEYRGWQKGNTIVYLARERDKNGDEDLQKACHHLEKLIEVECSRSNVGLEQLANLPSVGQQNNGNGGVGGLLHVHDVGEQVGHSHPIWAGELNNMTILRKDV